MSTNHVPAPSTTDHEPQTTPVDKSGERIKRMFGGISGRYDFLNHLLSGGTDVYWRWRAVRMCPPRGDAPILDVCTGTGDLALAYWKRASGPVVATDFTPEMLEIGRRKQAALQRSDTNRKLPPLEFLEADTMQLPFEDDLFQIVSVAFGLRNVSDTAAGLREMFRVCEPGGRVLVLEFSMPRTPVVGPAYKWYFRNVLPRIGQMFSRSRDDAYDYLPQSVSEFPDGERLANLMRECGAEAVEWKPLTFGVATIYLGTKGGGGGGAARSEGG